MSKKQKLLVIETGHLSTEAIAGGDLLMQGMINYLKELRVEIIIPKIAYHHWKSHKNAHFKTIPSIFLERYNWKPIIFLVYLWRALFTFYYLMRTRGDFIIYSSTNVFVDTIPAYIYMLVHRNTIWIARIHHLTQNPKKRPGNFLSNSVSYFIDRLCLLCIKKASLVIALNKSLRGNLLRVGFNKKTTVVLGGGVNFQEIYNFNKRN